MEERIKLLLVENDPAACGSIVAALNSADTEFCIVGVTNNCARAIQCVREFSPDAAILDVGDEDSYCLTFLQQLKDEKTVAPYTLVLASDKNKPAHERARKLGADFIMAYDRSEASARSVADFLTIARTVILARKAANSGTGSLEAAELEEKKLHRRICAELDKLGISSKCIGYVYLTEAIKIIIKHPVQHVCRIIGENKGKTANSVERAMQNSINRAWASTDSKELAENYTAKIKSSKGVPTITEFIHHYAHKLNNEI